MHSKVNPWLMLISRSVFFVLFQGLIFLILLASNVQDPWYESARWWPLMVFPANITSLYFLIRLYDAENKSFWNILRFSRKTWKSDLLWFIGFSLLVMPIAALPRVPLAAVIFGDADIATNLLFRPIPTWAFLASFLFPLTIWFAELPTYFGYCMPRIADQLKNSWLAWFLSSLFLAAQHMFLPLIFNGGYLLWRFGMFLPFALAIGLALKLRPRLLPYVIIAHALLDISTILVYLMI